MLLRIVKVDQWLLWETKYSSLQKLPRGIRMFTALGAQPSWCEFQHSMEKWSSLQPLVCIQAKCAKIINSSPRVAWPRELSGGFYKGEMIADLQSRPLGKSRLQPAVQPQEVLTRGKHLGPSAWPDQLGQRVIHCPHLLPASSPIGWCLFICIGRTHPGARNRTMAHTRLGQTQIHWLSKRKSWLKKRRSSIKGYQASSSSISVWVWSEQLSEEGDSCSGHTKPGMSIPTFSHFPCVILMDSSVNAVN